MSLVQRLDAEGQVSAGQFAVTTKRLDEFFGRLRRIQQRIEKRIAVGADQDHAVVFVQDSPGSLVRQIAR